MPSIGTSTDLREPLLSQSDLVVRMSRSVSSGMSSGTLSSLRRYRCFMLFFIGILVFFGIACLYSCPEDYCFTQRPAYTLSPPPAPLQTDIDFVNYDTIQHDNFEFNINGSDVMVFLHIQKTGGTTFGKHLVQDIDLESPCLCKRRVKKKKKHRKKYYVDDDEAVDRSKRKLKCDCFRPGKSSTWLFSRFSSTGWKCGLHADWTELTECVNDKLNDLEGDAKRRYFYITIIRDPIQRYLSEFKHVQRGATWKDAKHSCNGQSHRIPPCYDDRNPDSDWSGVKLDEFMQCPFNLAANRQTRMLADLKTVNCYNSHYTSDEKRDEKMLNSAKANLKKMAFFGLTEKQHESQMLFEHTFDLNFKKPFVQMNLTTSVNAESDLDQETIDKITKLNRLDVELYAFAKALMEQRYKWAYPTAK